MKAKKRLKEMRSLWIMDDLKLAYETRKTVRDGQIYHTRTCDSKVFIDTSKDVKSKRITYPNDLLDDN